MKAHAEVTNYFDELVNYKIDLIEKGNDVDARTMDIMGKENMTTFRQWVLTRLSSNGASFTN